jgi:hypothetical protein
LADADAPALLALPPLPSWMPAVAGLPASDAFTEFCVELMIDGPSAAASFVAWSVVMRLTSGMLMLVATTSAPLIYTARSIPNETCSPPTSKPPHVVQAFLFNWFPTGHAAARSRESVVFLVPLRLAALRILRWLCGDVQRVERFAQ